MISFAKLMLLPVCLWNHTLVVADTVYNMLEDSQGSKFNEAGVHLRTAAGIFERLHKVLIDMLTRSRASRGTRLTVWLPLWAASKVFTNTAVVLKFIGAVSCTQLLSPSCGSVCLDRTSEPAQGPEWATHGHGFERHASWFCPSMFGFGP